MSTLSTFRSAVDKKLKDDKHVLGTYSLDNTIYDLYIEDGVRQYSKKRPRKDIYEHTVVTGETTYFSLPTDWEEGFSSIIELEYPVTTDNKTKFPPEIVDQKSYKVDRVPSGATSVLRLIFIDYPYPSVGEIFWARYTKRHTVDATASSIPIADEAAVINLIMSICCNTIANYWLTTQSSSIGADVINYQSKADEYSKRASQYFSMYNGEIKDLETGIIGEWDPSLYTGENPLTHDQDYQ